MRPHHRPASSSSRPFLTSIVSLALAACSTPAERAANADVASAPGAAAPIEASAPMQGHAPNCAHPPFALSVAELGDGFLAVALVSPDGVPVLAGEWAPAERRFRPDTLALAGRFAAELAAAAEGALDFTEELAPEAVAELADLGGAAHRESLVAAFEGDARAAADQLALAAASLGSLLSRAPVVRALTGEDGGTCGAAPGFFPHACAEHAYCYALSVEADGPTREACDARFLADLRAEATFVSEPFVDLVHGAARAYGWRAWPAAR